jgi:drug/metabolite transporter (DMT)-like permease
VTGFFMSLYYVCLAGAYRSGQISIAYPLARAVPVVLVAATTFLIGRGHQVTLQSMIGAAVIVFGCLMLPMKRFRDINVRAYGNATCLLALAAAVGTAGYSMVDDEALHLLREACGGTAATVQITFAYACFEGLSSAAWLALAIGFRRDSRADLVSILRHSRGLAVGAGFMIYLTYGIVLVSLAFVSNVSYVVAFRQLSIPLGAGLGIVVLNEPPCRPKIVGVALMFLGLILVATG